MKDFLQYLVENIVSDKKAIAIDEQNEMGYINLYLSVAPADMGKIIGKDGRIIRAVRDLVRILSVKNSLRSNVILREV